MCQSATYLRQWPFCVLVALAAMSVADLARGADWSRFRGQNGSAVSEAQGLPVAWDADHGILWKTELPGAGSSSPIIVGDRVFLTCYSGYGVGENPGDIQDLQRRLICVSIADGRLLWDRTVAARQPEDRYSGFLRDHGYATSTPTSDGERVYVFFGKTGVLAFDLEGAELWRTSVGEGSAMNNWGSGSSPILYGDLVIVNVAAESKALVALDKATGKEVWRADAPNLYGSWCTPILVDAPDGKTEMVVSAPYELWGMNPETGDLLWFAEGIQDGTICGSPVARDGIVYAVGGRSGSAVAVRAGGLDDITKTNTLWSSSVSSYVPSPVLADDRILSVNERGVFSALDVTDGKVLLQKRLPGAGGIYASPVVGDGKAYVVTRGNGTYVVSITGDCEVLSHNQLNDDSDFNASPAIAEGRLLLRSNRFLYCLGDAASE